MHDPREMFIPRALLWPLSKNSKWLHVVFNPSPLPCIMSSAFSEGRITNPLKGHFQAKKAIHLTAFLFHECWIEFHGLVLHVKWPRLALQRQAAPKISNRGIAFRKPQETQVPLVISLHWYSVYRREAFKKVRLSVLRENWELIFQWVEDLDLVSSG